ncbi:MAG: phosphatidate cytidylyltransferase [Chloroflexi bacterium]|nr:phosphatidate cytidylyltransferase [Chloroflexota bacterium]
MSDPLALLLAFVYVSVVLALGEGLRRGLNLSVEFTRKFVHIGVGMVSFLLVLLFQSWQFAIIPPLVFIVVNFISYRRQIFSGMETGEKGQLGTVFFPISFAILIPLLWSYPALLVASLMPMTWGDAFAAIIGRRWGAHKFSVVGQTRSIEGSLVMFVLSFVATFIALVVFAQPPVVSLALSLVVALVATIVEAFSPFGIDNLTVPLTSALVLFLLK